MLEKILNAFANQMCLLRPKRSGNLGNGSSGSKIHVSDGGNTKKRQIPDSGEHVVKRLKEWYRAAPAGAAF
uniref:Uncharacterized protein n=1 Tax=Romanomermis culicivorax TaxID=13658 RepID=A0A915K514_ROMCU